MSETNDADPIINDPLREFNFSNVDQHYANDEDMPDELQQLFNEFDLGKIKYRIQLKQFPDPELGKSEYIKSFSNHVPTVDWVAMEYGPGKYLYNVIFRRKDPETGMYKNRAREYEFTISNKFQTQYEEYQFQKRIKRMKDEKDMVRQVRHTSEIEQAITGGGEKQQSPKEYLMELTETATKLGLINNGNKAGGFNIQEILTAVAPFLPSLITAFTERARAQSDRFDKMLMLMIQQQNDSSNKLVELMKGLKGPTSGTDQMKEVRDMIFSAIDIKKSINGDTESIADRIFNLAQGVLPQILSIAQMSQQQRAMSPQYMLAKSYMERNPDIQAMKENPAIREDVIARFDETFGPEQTNTILQVAGIPRSMPENYDGDRGYQNVEQPETETGPETDENLTEGE